MRPSVAAWRTERVELEVSPRDSAAAYNMPGPVDHQLDQELLARLVPLRRLGKVVAVAQRKQDGRQSRRQGYKGPTVDSELRRAGITFQLARSLWHAYERATRHMAEEPLPDGRTTADLCATERKAVVAAYVAELSPQDLHTAHGLSWAQVLELVDADPHTLRRPEDVEG